MTKLQIYRRPSAPPLNGCVLTLGNFDGVHRGHQALLKALCAEADATHPPLVMSFYPHPKNLLTTQPSVLLSTIRDRAHWLEHYGIRHWWLVPFNQRLRQTSATDFIRDYVLPLKPKALWVGEDFRFGYQGSGNIETLKHAGDVAGFQVHTLPDHQLDGNRVSSSRIRQALQSHNLNHASDLLGHPLSFTGKVMTGFSRGKALSTPTANLHLPPDFALPNGVYVVDCDNLAGLSRVFGVANVGVNPTFNGTVRKLEVHFFMPPRDLYGARLRIRFWHYLRPEKRFDTQSALVAQIQHDIHAAQTYISQQESS